MREPYELRREKLPPAAWMTANSASPLGECLLALERYDEAEPLLINSYAALRSSLGDSNPRTREAQQRLIRFYEATGRAEQAQALSPARPSQPCAP